MSPKKLRLLIAAQILAFLIGIGALINTVHVSEADRIGARRDTCELIVGLARAAAGKSPKALAAANTYIASTQLHDCNAYAHMTHSTGRKHAKSRQ